MAPLDGCRMHRAVPALMWRVDDRRDRGLQALVTRLWLTRAPKPPAEAEARPEAARFSAWNLTNLSPLVHVKIGNRSQKCHG